MAKSKRQHRYPVTRTAGTGDLHAAAQNATLDLKDYVLLNVLFDAFCILQFIIVRMLLPDMLGLYFFFGFIMVAFLIVSAFDYVAGAIVADEPAAHEVEKLL